jgi:MoxR-like ATPase
MSKISTDRVIEIVEKILNDSDRIEIDLNDPAMDEVKDQITKSRVRLELSNKGIAVTIPPQGSTITINRVGAAISVPAVHAPKKAKAAKPKSQPKAKGHQHTYIPPKMAKDVMDALLDEGSHVIWFKGPTGSGKTVLAHYLAKELGMELYQLNCHKFMSVESFFGEKTIEIDEASKQNHIAYLEGIVVKAMTQGLDEDGNEVGRPGQLFIDEAGAIPPSLSIALNRLLESDDPRRTITLELDGGRVIRSHSGLRIIFSANTAGRGATDMMSSMYTAQMDALDISLLNRIALTFKFGYSRSVEKAIAKEKIGNDRIVSKIMKFRDIIRKNIRAGNLSTPFSTRTIIQISDAYRIYNDLAKAIYYTTFEKLLPEEMAIYNEKAVAQLGVDILREFVDDDMDYMD